jgi:hypothetical protein
VFTEYRDTQIWLKELLAQEGLAGDRVKLLYGGMDSWHREQLRLAFQEPPHQNKVRILLATPGTQAVQPAHLQTRRQDSGISATNRWRYLRGHVGDSAHDHRKGGHRA